MLRPLQGRPLRPTDPTTPDLMPLPGRPAPALADRVVCSWHGCDWTTTTGHCVCGRSVTVAVCARCDTTGARVLCTCATPTLATVVAMPATGPAVAA
ncbi:MAG TPA: hypothetical protein VGD67_14490 [Pseudonocardiaceae bacterium]